MPYVIETFDKVGSGDIRAERRGDHLSYLEEHKSILLLCGAKLNDDGSDKGGGFYVVEVNSRQEADSFIRGDPFYKAGLFDKITIVRWRKAYVKSECYL